MVECMQFHMSAIGGLRSFFRSNYVVSGLLVDCHHVQLRDVELFQPVLCKVQDLFIQRVRCHEYLEVGIIILSSLFHS